MNTSDEIKKMRKEMGLSQAAFGEYLEIPRRTIQAWEEGNRMPPEYVVRLIAYRLRMEGHIAKDGVGYEKSEDEGN